MSISCLFVGHDWYQFSTGQWCIRCGVKSATNNAQLTAALVIPTVTPQPKAQPKPAAVPQVLNVQAEQPSSQAITGMEDLQLERELGKGGMGIVYLMTSKRDHRRFAAKRTHLASSESRIQFLRELQVWIALPPHPHVLPLQFFRTMPDVLMIFTEYMAGGSMQDWLGTPKLRDLATILDLAIQYAWGLHALHELDLIHQDVKPGNALIDGAGILKVADFGLVRARRYGDVALVVNAKADVQATHAGLYTPAYCSPEQEQGQRLTKHTDIWSWGLSVLAMFYGTNPTDSGISASQALAKLQTKRGKRTSCVPLPEDVAEVLKRCFQDKPNSRWPSLLDAAKVLVELYPKLCSQPYPRPQPKFTVASERLQVQHDRRGASGGGIQWPDPRVYLEEALQADGRNPAEAEQMLAAQASSRKGQAVGDLVLYDEAYRILNRLMQEGRKELRQQLAALCMNKAFIHRYLNDPSGNIIMLDQSIALYQYLVEQEGRLKLVDDLATALMNKVIALMDIGRLPQAIALCDQTITSYKRMVEQDGLQELEASLAPVLMNKAVVVSAMGQLLDAVALYDQAIISYKHLVEQEGRLELEDSLAMALVNKANAVYKMGQLPQAAILYDQAITSYQRLVEQEGRQELEDNLASALANKANAVYAMGQLPEAADLYDQAIAIRQRLVDQEGRLELEDSLAMTLMNKANVVRDMGKLQQAVLLYDQAITTYQRLVEQEGQRELEHDLAMALMNKATAIKYIGELPQAVVLYDQAITRYQRLVDQEGRRELEHDLAMTLMNKAVVVLDMDRSSEAVALSDQAITYYQRLVGQEGRRELENDFAMAVMNKANAISKMGQLPQAIVLYDQTITRYQRLVDQEGRRELTGEWARATLNRAVTLDHLGDSTKAIADTRWVIATLEQEVVRTRRADLDHALKVARSNLESWTKVNIPKITQEHLLIAFVDGDRLGDPGLGGSNFQKAIQCYNERDNNGSISFFEKALELGLDPLRQGYAHSELGQLKLKRGSFSEGVEHLFKVLMLKQALYDSIHTAVQYLNVILLELGRVQEAQNLQVLIVKTQAKLGYSLSSKVADEIRLLVRQQAKN